MRLKVLMGPICGLLCRVVVMEGGGWCYHKWPLHTSLSLEERQ